MAALAVWSLWRAERATIPAHLNRREMGSEEATAVRRVAQHLAQGEERPEPRERARADMKSKAEKPVAETPASSRKLGEALDSIERPGWKVWQGASISMKGHQPSDARVLGGAAGFSIYEDSESHADPTRFDLRYPIAVFNERTSKVGILTGTVRIVLKEGTTWDEFSSDHDLVLTAPFSHLRTYMVTSTRSPFDLVELVRTLKADGRAEILEPEILSRVYVKN